MNKRQRPQATALDIFCGAGGLTRGLLNAGVRVAAGYDIDEGCRFPYEHNNLGVRFHKRCVTTLSGRGLKRHYPKGHARILVGCAPCQTFSKYTQGICNRRDPEWKLLKEFTRLVRELKPDIVSMENVVELRRYEIFQEFLSALIDAGYHFSRNVKDWIVQCADYGVPQYRRRLVIIASRLGPIQLIPPTHRPSNHRKIADVLRRFQPLRAGQISESDPLHRSSNLSKRNLQRIRASKPGGSWRDWPRDLRAKCHRSKTGKSYPSVYGRMEWQKPSPTITTEFYGFGSGRFGHPTQNRALSLREGAILQSFPRGYKFAQKDSAYNFKKLGKLIGNAVPVRLGAAIGKTITRHLAQHEK